MLALLTTERCYAKVIRDVMNFQLNFILTLEVLEQEYTGNDCECLQSNYVDVEMFGELVELFFFSL